MQRISKKYPIFAILIQLLGIGIEIGILTKVSPYFSYHFIIDYLTVSDSFLNLTLEEWGDYMVSQNIIPNREWINETFIPLMQKKIGYLF
jgi:hypothetical protein